jgi:hypothetical protein
VTKVDSIAKNFCNELMHLEKAPYRYKVILFGEVKGCIFEMGSSLDMIPQFLPR